MSLKGKDWLVLGGLGLFWLYSKSSKTPITYPAQPAYPGSPVDPVTGLPSGIPVDPGIAQQDVQQQVAIDLQTGKVLGSLDASVAGSAAALAGASTTGEFLALTATEWTVIGAVIVGIIILVEALRTDVHLYANELVQKYENPFGNYVIKIIQHMTDGLNAGTLLHADAIAMTQAIESAWTKYQSVMAQLMAKGTDWLIVAKQSLNNLDNQFRGETLPNGHRLDMGMGGVYPNGFMTQWLSWMHTVTDSLTN